MTSIVEKIINLWNKFPYQIGKKNKSYTIDPSRYKDF